MKGEVSESGQLIRAYLRTLNWEDPDGCITS